MKISLHVTGRRYHATEQLPDDLELPEGATLDELLAELASRSAEPLPDSCLIAVAGEHVGTVQRHQNRSLRDGDEVVLLSPVAGG